MTYATSEAPSDDTFEICTVSNVSTPRGNNDNPNIPIMTDENSHLFDGEGNYVGEQEKFDEVLS